MDFNYTDTQDMLRDTLARFLADTYDFESRKKMIASADGRDPGIWRALATELGILSAPFSEEQGGLGGGALENMIMLEELGKVIAIEPYLQTVVIGGGALKAAGGALADAVIPEIIGGNVIIGFAYAEPKGRYDLANLTTIAKKDGAGFVLNGHKAVVYAAPWATHLLVTARTGGSQRERNGVELFLIDANLPGVTRRDYPTVDGFRASEIYFENVSIPAGAHLPGVSISAPGPLRPLAESIQRALSSSGAVLSASGATRLSNSTAESAGSANSAGTGGGGDSG